MLRMNREWAFLAGVVGTLIVVDVFQRAWWWAVINLSLLGIATLIAPPTWLRRRR